MKELSANDTAHIIVIKDPHRYADERIATQQYCHENISWYFHNLTEALLKFKLINFQ